MRHDDDMSAASSLDGRAGGVFILSVVLTAIVAFFDLLSGTQISLSFFYLVPIVLTCWKVGRPAGLVIALISAAAFPLTDLLAGGRFEADWIPLWNFVVRSGTFVSVVFLTSSLNEALRRERDLSRLDPLTGLFNSRWFVDQAQREIDAARAGGAPITVAYMDLDNFKIVNDDHGHAAGDDLLREVGRILKRSTRSGDLVGRLGGDEFGLLLPSMDATQSAPIVDRILGSLMEHARDGGLPVSFSIGQVTSSTGEESIDELLWFADHLMYSAKRSGKARTFRRTLAGGEARAFDFTARTDLKTRG